MADSCACLFLCLGKSKDDGYSGSRRIEDNYFTKLSVLNSVDYLHLLNGSKNLAVESLVEPGLHMRLKLVLSEIPTDLL